MNDFRGIASKIPYEKVCCQPFNKIALEEKLSYIIFITFQESKFVREVFHFHYFSCANKHFLLTLLTSTECRYYA